MNNSNFNASELETTYSIIRKINSAFSMLAFAGAGSSDTKDDVYNRIVSEDSKLAATWKNSAELSGDIGKRANQLLTNLKTEIETYAKATIANEQKTAQEINNINASLSDNRAKLEEIEI